MFDHTHYARLGLAGAYERTLAGTRLTPEDGEALFACPDIHFILVVFHCRTIFINGKYIHLMRSWCYRNSSHLNVLR